MKINSIGFYSPSRTPKNTFQSTDAPRFNVGMHTSPISRALAADQISFTRSQPLFFLKNIRGLHCPCSGIEMATAEDFDSKIDKKLYTYTSGDAAAALSPFEDDMNVKEKSYLNQIKNVSNDSPAKEVHRIFGASPAVKQMLNQIDEKFLAPTGGQIIENLSYFEDCMHPVEKECFQLIKEEVNKNPEKKLNEILQTLKPEHFEKLKVKEFQILDQIDEKGGELSEESFAKLKIITDLARKTVVFNGEEVFKRRLVRARLLKLSDQIPEKQIAKELYKIADTFPTSGGDLDAFVVKYAERDSKEIAQRLVSTAVGTVEHIKPEILGGDSDVVNYILESAGSNNNRGDDTFFEFLKDNPQMIHNIPEGTDMGGLSVQKWIKIHPEHKGNVQKHMDEVVELINKGIIKGHAEYPAAVARTIDVESKGLIKLYLSSLNSNTAKKTKPLVDKSKSTALADKSKQVSPIRNKHPKIDLIPTVKTKKIEKPKKPVENDNEPIDISKPSHEPKKKHPKVDATQVEKSKSSERKSQERKESLKKIAQVLKKQRPKTDIKPPVKKDDEPINIFKPRPNSDKKNNKK